MPSSEAQVSDDGAFGVGQVHVRGPPRDRVSEMGPHHTAIEGAQEHFDEVIDDTDIPRIRPRRFRISDPIVRRSWRARCTGCWLMA